MIDKAFQMPGMNASGLPSGTQPFADMSQGLAWMQNMWSSYMNSPMAPTLDVDELDRRVHDALGAFALDDLGRPAVARGQDVLERDHVVVALEERQTRREQVEIGRAHV